MNSLPESIAVERSATKKKVRLKMHNPESGKVGWILLWAVGVPIPVLLLLFLLRGCT
jgi:hypothetical protein